MPYLPEQLYADLRRLSMFRDQLNEDRIRSINRLHRELKIYFPEYKEALRKTEGTFSLELLKQEPFPDDLATLKEDGIDRSGIMRNLEDAGIAELEKSWSTPRRVLASVKEKKQGNWLYSGLFKKSWNWMRSLH